MTITVWWWQERNIAASQLEGHITAQQEAHTMLQQCAAAVTSARANAPWLPVFEPIDIEAHGGNPNLLTEAVFETIKIHVDNLVNCLPSVVNFSRQYFTREPEIQAPDVARLLDICVDSIAPASIALSKAAHSATVDDGSIDFESIERVFDEQAKARQKWREKHRQDIETRLAENNPAKLASAADSIGNIAVILGKHTLVKPNICALFNQSCRRIADLIGGIFQFREV